MLKRVQVEHGIEDSFLVQRCCFRTVLIQTSHEYILVIDVDELKPIFERALDRKDVLGRCLMQHMVKTKKGFAHQLCTCTMAYAMSHLYFDAGKPTIFTCGREFLYISDILKGLEVFLQGQAGTCEERCAELSRVSRLPLDRACERSDEKRG